MKRFAAIGFLLLTACAGQEENEEEQRPVESVWTPEVVTEAVKYDSDDPAIWVNSENPSESIVFGTDKDEDGAIYAFDLKGKIIEDKLIKGIKRPNNVDLEYGFQSKMGPIDILVFTERLRSKIRVFSVPDMRELDNGGIDVFVDAPEGKWNKPMGIALYKEAESGNVYAIVGRKNGPTDGTYLHQYLLQENDSGIVEGELVRKFGFFSGLNEIEAIAVDDENAIVYCSDEGFNIRANVAHPDAGSVELAVWGGKHFKEDIEGLALRKMDDGSMELWASDQQDTAIQVFRPGAEPEFLRSFKTSSLETDGIEITTANLGPPFEKGMFVAMSDDKTFHFYKLK